MDFNIVFLTLQLMPLSLKDNEKVLSIEHGGPPLLAKL